jgi:hypothetical protein
MRPRKPTCRPYCSQPKNNGTISPMQINHFHMIEKRIHDAVENINNNLYWKTFLVIAAMYLFKSQTDHQLQSIQDDIDELRGKQTIVLNR